MTFVIAMLLMAGVAGWLDSRLNWRARLAPHRKETPECSPDTSASPRE